MSSFILSTAFAKVMVLRGRDRGVARTDFVAGEGPTVLVDEDAEEPWPVPFRLRPKNASTFLPFQDGLGFFAGMASLPAREP